MGLLLLFSCQTINHQESTPFRVADARYYSWFVNEKERGVNVEITLEKLKGEIQFEALVFRNKRIPVATIIDHKRVVLKGVLPGPQSALEDRTGTATGPDRLLYIFNGDSASVNLENILRGDMKYLKPQ
jgi:hypothetical protein